MSSSSFAAPKSSLAPRGCRSNTNDAANRPCLRWLLNRLSSLAAIVGITRFCILVGRGDYDAWAVPLLISASVCKFLTTAVVAPGYHRYDQRKWGCDSRSSMPATWYQRTERCFHHSTAVRTLAAISHSLRRRLENDNRHNVLCLSLAIVVAPCAVYFAGKVLPLLDPGKIEEEGLNHKKLANDFGKLGAAGLAFLLLPVSKFSALFAAMGWSEVHVIRLHIAAGCTVLFGGIIHGLYYTYIWIELKGYSYEDVFPSSECWGGLRRREYDKDCHEELVNLLGIICGTSLLALGLSSLYWVRRRCYRLFYSVHVIVSVVVLFGLAMHYNKMILYMAPSLLYYLGSNLPVHVESAYKWWRSRRRRLSGGVEVSKVVCIPESGGCVELSFCVKDETATRVVTDNENRVEDDFRALRDTIGKFVKLLVPELSAQSHPFTVFGHPNHPAETVQILFRPSGSFTNALSKRLQTLTSLPEPTPSEIENHHHTFFPGNHTGSFLQHGGDGKSFPTMLVNGVRRATSDMFDKAMSHDRIVIFAGGVGIVSYISLIHTLRLESALMSNNGSTYGKKNNGGRHGKRELNHHQGTYGNEENLEEGRLASNGENDGNPTVLGRAAKCIDVYWMSRDEGLIRHVLQKYFVPFASCGDDVGGMSTNNNDPLSLSINIVIHHTSSHSSALSPMIGSPNNNDTNIDCEATTTWQPGRGRRRQQHTAVSMAGEGGTTSHHDDDDESHPPLFVPLASAYEGNKLHIVQNTIPSITFALVAFGGLWIVDYCYDNLQDKHVVETRSFAVAGILALSLAVSLVSNAVILTGKLFYSKWLMFSYSKLDENGNGDGINGSNGSEGNNGGEIECAKVGADPSDKMWHQFSFNGFVGAAVKDGHDGFFSNHQESCPPSSSMSPEASEVEGDNAVMSITHVQGRPNLSAIVRNVMMGGEQEQETIAVANDERSCCRDSGRIDEGGTDDGMDVGIFMCGPTVMTHTVWNAVKKEEKERGFCKGSDNPFNRSGRKPVAIYQEVFEL